MSTKKKRKPKRSKKLNKEAYRTKLLEALEERSRKTFGMRKKK
jgi:hypothetical protein